MRYDAFSERDPAVRDASLPQGERDLSLWLHRAPGEPHPLEHYRWRSSRPIALGKDMVDPARMAAYEVRALSTANHMPEIALHCRVGAVVALGKNVVDPERGGL